MTQKNRSRSFPLLFAATASADDFAHAQPPPPPQPAQCWRCARACVCVRMCVGSVCCFFVAFLHILFLAWYKSFDMAKVISLILAYILACVFLLLLLLLLLPRVFVIRTLHASVAATAIRINY